MWDGEFEALWARILQEARLGFTHRVRFVYLFGQTADNQVSVLAMARAWACPIGMPGMNAVSGYPGFPVWKQELLKRGISEDRIIPIHGSLVDVGGKQISHTRSEATALVRYCKVNGIREIIVVAPEFHLVRAYMSVVSALLEEEYPELRVYPAMGKHLPWDEVVVHSQGMLRRTRRKLISEEKERVHTYYEKGDLVHPRRMFAYMNWMNWLRK